MVVVRLPASSEKEAISELVLQSDCGMLSALFGPSVRTLLQHLQGRPDNPYSSTNTLVIVDEAGQAAGALVGSPAAATRKANIRTAGHLLAWYGPALIVHLPGLLRAGKALHGLGPNDFYLSHIAVRPELRGQGLGAVLLRAAEEHAKALGAQRVVLDVEEHNEGARAFYARLDYEDLSVVRIDLRRGGRFTFRRLGKAL
jgi:ribosomal protein S18 acetylase RimI-like enzyme